MDLFATLSQILILSFTIGLSFWALKYVVSFYVFSRKKEQINKLNARISILKLHLKGKVKKKVHKIEDALRKDGDILTLARPQLNKLMGIEFDHAADYQEFIAALFEVTVIISEHVRSKHKNLLRTEILLDLQPERVRNDDEEILSKCTKLVKYDKAHMTIIVEIIQATNELIIRIEEFNMLTDFEHGQKKITLIPDKIEIEHFDIIHGLVEQARHSEIDVPDFPILEKTLFGDAA
jgi:hypothetical protein